MEEAIGVNAAIIPQTAASLVYDQTGVACSWRMASDEAETTVVSTSSGVAGQDALENGLTGAIC
jgi:hypothetical protein